MDEPTLTGGPTTVPDAAGEGEESTLSVAVAPAADDDGVARLGRGRRAAAAPLPVVDEAHYELGAEHARGGLGRILRGRDRRLARPVAVKELIVENEETRARFVREARITARLQHPGIVPIYEAGRWSSGHPFYAMKMVAGQPLSAVIAARKELAERLALLPKVLAVAETMAYAHSQGVVHRDLKPGNVLVGEYGETVVIDWGLAKELDDPGAAPPLPGPDSGVDEDAVDDGRGGTL